LFKRKGKIFLDLAQANLLQLQKSGVKEKNIYDCGMCTSCQQDFFSYRRDGQNAGRMMSVIMIKKNLP
jgi:copper oxidase (laccase) domain-containing protein